MTSVPVKVLIAKDEAVQEHAPTVADVDPLRELVVAFAVARALAKFTFALAWAIGNVFELFWRIGMKLSKTAARAVVPVGVN